MSQKRIVKGRMPLRLQLQLWNDNHVPCAGVKVAETEKTDSEDEGEIEETESEYDGEDEGEETKIEKIVEKEKIIEDDESVFTDILISINKLKMENAELKKENKELKEELKQTLKRKEQIKYDESNECVWVVKKMRYEEV